MLSRLPKSLLLLATLGLVAPAFGADTARDASAAWRCKTSDTIVTHYWPAGRKPSRSERARCATAGGRIAPPPAKAPASRADRAPR